MSSLVEQEYLNDKERWNILVSVSNLYYNSDMTQSEISKRLYISRSKVSRLLKEAKEKGIVKIIINEPWDRNLELEAQFQEKFPNLLNIKVMSIKEEDCKSVLSKLGEFSAYYIDTVINDNTIIGVSWGNTLFNIVNSIKSSKNIDLTVVPIMGAAITNNLERDSIDLSKEFASRYAGKCHYIYAPLFVNSKELKDSLIKDEKIKEVLDIAKKANIILTSVGSIEYKTWKSYFKAGSLEILSKKGAIGHIGGHFYDINGNEIVSGLRDRLIGIEIEDIKNTKEVICVAGLEVKALPVLGALRGGFINSIIIDEICARKVLQLENE